MNFSTLLKFPFLFFFVLTYLPSFLQFSEEANASTELQHRKLGDVHITSSSCKDLQMFSKRNAHVTICHTKLSRFLRFPNFSITSTD